MRLNISRREALKLTGVGAGLAIGAPLVLVQTGCDSTKQLVKWTATGIGVLHDISPILTDMGASQVVDLIAKALPLADKLKKAFQDNDNVSAGQFLQNLIEPQTGLISQIADAVGLLADDARKKIILGSLAIAQVSFRLISAQIDNDVPTNTALVAAKAAPRTVSAIKKAAGPDKLQLAFEATRF